MLRAARCNGSITDFDYAGFFHMEVVKMWSLISIFTRSHAASAWPSLMKEVTCPHGDARLPNASEDNGYIGSWTVLFANSSVDRYRQFGELAEKLEVRTMFHDAEILFMQGLSIQMHIPRINPHTNPTTLGSEGTCLISPKITKRCQGPQKGRTESGEEITRVKAQYYVARCFKHNKLTHHPPSLTPGLHSQRRPVTTIPNTHTGLKYSQCLAPHDSGPSAQGSYFLEDSHACLSSASPKKKKKHACLSRSYGRLELSNNRVSPFRSRNRWCNDVLSFCQLLPSKVHHAALSLGHMFDSNFRILVVKHCTLLMLLPSTNWWTIRDLCRENDHTLDMVKVLA